MLLNEIKQYLLKNKIYIYTCMFFTLVSYGYFITNWAISIDSEFHTFAPASIWLGWASQGRLLLGIINLIGNFYKIIPFWNDFIAVFLLFISSLILVVSLAKIKYSAKGLFIFQLIYLISPIYCFYLRFTMYNVAVSFGFVFISLAFYYLVLLLEREYLKKSLLVASSILLLCAISIYQMFVVYYITGFLIILIYKIINTDFISRKLFYKYLVRVIFISSSILVASFVLYKLISAVSFLFVNPDTYMDQFLGWHRFTFHQVVSGLIDYMLNITCRYKFNFFIPLTVFLVILCILYKIISHSFNLVIFMLCLALFVSGFALPIGLGFEIPLRAMMGIPLMMSGTWLLVYDMVNTRARKLILVVAVIASIFNGQYITRLFYSDNMRLMYDMNFANRLYSFVIDRVGSRISKKPLVIIGHHYYEPKPFFLRSDYDTIGASFFGWDNGNYQRMHSFMEWLGDDYKLPTAKEFTIAKQMAFFMPEYPDNGSLIETKDMIILKLSSYSADNQPLKLDLSLYNKLNSSQIDAYLDSISIKSNSLNLTGWGYLKNKDAANTVKLIKLSMPSAVYFFIAHNQNRLDVERVKNGEALNVIDSGYVLNLNNPDIKKGTYSITLILLNGNNYGEFEIKHSFTIK